MVRKYRLGFILTVQLGNSTRFEILKKFAQRDPEVDFFWAPIDYRSSSATPFIRFIRHISEGLYWRLLVLRETWPVLKNFRTMDAIMVHQFEPSLVLSIARYFGRKPAIVSSTDDTPLINIKDHPMYANELRRSSFTQKLRLRIDLWRARRADISIPMSKWAADILVKHCGVNPETVHPLHVGLDFERWPKVTRVRAERSTTKKLLFVGSDFERKGGEMLLKVHQQHFAERAELHLVAKGITHRNFPNVFWYSDLSSHDEQLRDLYGQSDIFVLPTHSDVSSWVALEAHASSLPVIITDVGGISEIVVDGETGILLKRGDEAGLVSAIERLLNDPQKCKEFGEAGRSLVERSFNAETNVRRILSLMKGIGRRTN